ncbi:MAG: transglutaminase domain-containing protein [Akkermansiaceae bacterium]|nr:transglutaminase domain-containing protein [Akkermansiaceae bacterium]
MSRNFWKSLLAKLVLALSLVMAGAPDAASAAGPPDGGNRGYRLDRRLAQTVEATYQVDISTPRLTAREWVLVWPKAPDHPAQRVLAAACKPQGVVITDRSPLRQPLWRVPVRVAAEDPPNEVSFAVKIRAELFSRRLVSDAGSAKVPALGPAERQSFTRSTPWFDYDSPEFAEWVKAKGLDRGDSEGEITFARRVFVKLASDFEYEYLMEMNRVASAVCRAGKSDCGGLSGLFVTILRAEGIPARMLAGRWALSAKKDHTIGEVRYFQEHVKAEFFAQGVGWVPVDVSSAVLHDKSAAKSRFFGNDLGDFIILHFDHELSFDTGIFGLRWQPLLQRAAYWAAGQGDFQDAVMREGWTVSAKR